MQIYLSISQSNQLEIVLKMINVLQQVLDIAEFLGEVLLGHVERRADLIELALEQVKEAGCG